MITYDEKTLRKIQMVELELLKEADRICRKNDIHYNIIAGTLLGAVRHQGFIPWDDDADIALLREEYERFVEACKRDLDHSKYYFQDHRETEGYRWGYGKLRKKETLFLREYQEEMPYEQGIFIDVFPLDSVSDWKPIRKWQDLKCFLLRKILWSPVGQKAETNGCKRLVYRLLAKIPEQRAKNMLDRMIASSHRPGKWVRILMFPTPNQECGYRREWYEYSDEILFEDHSFIGIRNYDDYLLFKYGDYHVLPPLEKRKIHPVSALKLPDDIAERKTE